MPRGCKVVKLCQFRMLSQTPERLVERSFAAMRRTEYEMRIICVPYKTLSALELIPRKSHPVSLSRLLNYTCVCEQGLECEIEGKKVHVGKATWVRERTSADNWGSLADLDDHGHTTVCVCQVQAREVSKLQELSSHRILLPCRFAKLVCGTKGFSKSRLSQFVLWWKL